MKSRSITLFALLVGICAILISGSATAQVQDTKTQEIKLDSPELQALIDQLFGTSTSDGLLQGTKRFDLRVQNLVLTPEQADLFFTASTTNTRDISDLIAKAEAIKGSELKISGTIDGKPFDLKMEGKQVKADGLVLSQAEFDALIAQLKATTGLHEAKIEATVDGQLKVAKLENIPGRVKIENRDLHEKDEHPTPRTEHHSEKTDADVRSSFADRGDHDARPEKIEKIERPEKVEKIERPEKIERVERPDKTEHIERPEVAQGGGKGRG